MRLDKYFLNLLCSRPCKQVHHHQLLYPCIKNPKLTHTLSNRVLSWAIVLTVMIEDGEIGMLVRRGVLVVVVMVDVVVVKGTVVDGLESEEVSNMIDEESKVEAGGITDSLLDAGSATVEDSITDSLVVSESSNVEAGGIRDSLVDAEVSRVEESTSESLVEAESAKVEEKSTANSLVGVARIGIDEDST